MPLLMDFTQLIHLLHLLGIVLLLGIGVAILVYRVATRSPKPEVMQLLWMLFWRGPVLIVCAVTLKARLDMVSAILCLLLVVGPLELRRRCVSETSST